MARFGAVGAARAGGAGGAVRVGARGERGAVRGRGADHGAAAGGAGAGGGGGLIAEVAEAEACCVARPGFGVGMLGCDGRAVGREWEEGVVRGERAVRWPWSRRRKLPEPARALELPPYVLPQVLPYAYPTPMRNLLPRVRIAGGRALTASSGLRVTGPLCPQCGANLDEDGRLWYCLACDLNFTAG